MDLLKVITKRTIALIILRVSGTLAGGSIAGVELWQAALLAAFIGVMDVAESLSRSYVVDGELCTDEINTAFASSAEAELAKTKTADVAPVAAVAAVAVATPVLFDVEEEEEEFDFDEDEDDK